MVTVYERCTCTNKRNKGKEVELFEIEKYVKKWGDGRLDVQKLHTVYAQYVYLDHGCTRVVFDRGDGWVVKLCYTTIEGVCPNAMELEVYRRGVLPMAKTLEGDGYIIQEKITPSDSHDDIRRLEEKIPEIWTRDLQAGVRDDGSICLFDLSHCTTAYKQLMEQMHVYSRTKY